MCVCVCVWERRKIELTVWGEKVPRVCIWFVCLSVYPLHKCMSFKMPVSMDFSREALSGRALFLVWIIFNRGRPLPAGSSWFSVHKSIVSDSMYALPALCILQSPTHHRVAMLDRTVGVAFRLTNGLVTLFRHLESQLSDVASQPDWFNQLYTPFDLSLRSACTHKRRSIQERTKLTLQYLVVLFASSSEGPKQSPLISSHDGKWTSTRKNACQK